MTLAGIVLALGVAAWAGLKFFLWPAPPLSSGAPRVVLGVYEHQLLAPDGSLWRWRDKECQKSVWDEEDISATPQRIGSDSDWSQLAGNQLTVALKADGSLWAWGGFPVVEGRLGWGRAFSPARISPDTDWTQIAARGDRCLALKKEGSLWDVRQYPDGRGSHTNRFFITRIGQDRDWKTIATSGFTSYALKQNGTLWAWGGDYDLAPRQIDAAGDVVAISAHDMILLAIRADSTLWICGSHAYLTAPDSASSPARTLVQIGREHDWTGVCAGARFFFARKASGSWWVGGRIRDVSRNSPMAPLWDGRALRIPRRLALSPEPQALAPGSGTALLLGRDGDLWKLAVQPDDSRSAVMRLKLMTFGNRACDFLPTRPHPFDVKRLRLVATKEKLWQLPPEARTKPGPGSGHGS